MAMTMDPNVNFKLTNTLTQTLRPILIFNLTLTLTLAR